MIDKDFEELKQDWYNAEPVQFEIVKNLIYRETALIHVIDGKKTMRCLKINAVKYLNKNDERYSIFEDYYNMYGSLAHFPNLPMFSFSSHVKRQQQKEFNEKFIEYMKGYDFLLDIDNDDVFKAYESAKKIKKIFDNYQVRYYLIFSGKKGFHIKVDYADFPEKLKKLSFSDLIIKFKKFGENFKLINRFEDIDLSIFDLRRIAKTPYSIVYPNYLIALPLSDRDFETWTIEKVSLPYWLKNIELVRNRGVLKRDGNPDNFYKLIKDYIEV